MNKIVIKDNKDLGYVNTFWMDGQNKLFNILISARYGGKTTVFECYKALIGAAERDLGNIFIKRFCISINEAEIKAIEARINNMILNDNDKITLYFKSTEIKTGHLRVMYTRGRKLKKKPFATFIALNKSLQDLKQICVPKLKNIIFDEYIANSTKGEKYLKDEWNTLLEFVNTVRRFEYKPRACKVYLIGNPYTRYNPAVVGLNINTHLIKAGCKLKGKNWVLQCYDLPDKLRKYLKKTNPMLDIDNSDYIKYSFEGKFVNDEHIPVEKLKPFYKLWYLFFINGILLGIYFNRRGNFPYYVRKMPKNDKNLHKRKELFCFDLDDVNQNAKLIDSGDDEIDAIRRNLLFCFKNYLVSFSHVECYYLLKEVYNEIG